MVATNGAALPLTQAGLMNACQQAGLGIAEIWALVHTETDFPYAGFLESRKPQILFERHIFSRLTKGIYDAKFPEVSNPIPGGYGAAGQHQHDRLTVALKLDEGAAIQAASWGIGQTLGENYSEVGYATPQDMLQDMILSEDAQLLAAIREILASNIDGALRSHDWANFARVYNGPAYAKNNYDTILATQYAAYSHGKTPDLFVRSAQIYLMYLGHNPDEIDGIFGPRTRSAMNEFQATTGLRQTDELDETTLNALIRAV